MGRKNMIIHTKPEIYQRLVDTFGIDWNKGIIITYNGKIYCKTDISDDLIVHENTHIKQQENQPDWWDKYIEDKNFRLSQEIEAYKAQYEYVKGNYPRWARRKVLKAIATDLSSYIYGNIISYEDAVKVIQ